MSETTTWHQTACILCSINCGIEVRLDGRRLARIRGDKAHPGSQGYTCEKALRLDHYQNGARPADDARCAAGRTARFEPIDWDTAIAEVARALRRASATRTAASRSSTTAAAGRGTTSAAPTARRPARALGSVYTSNALAQEKTGEFWVDGQLFGRPRCHTTRRLRARRGRGVRRQEPVAVARLPARPRRRCKAIANDPGAGADRHRPAPHRDGRAGRLPPPGASGHRRLLPGGAARACSWRRTCSTTPSSPSTRPTASALFAALAQVDDRRRTARAPACAEDARARRRPPHRARATSVSIFEDLGIQQAPHSTLNSYLEKLVYPAHRQLRPARAAMNIHTAHGRPRRRLERRQARAPVGGHRIITGLIPGNVDPRRDPHRPPEALPRHARRERQPGPLARRQPAHARGARRARAGRGDRRRHDRDRAPRALRAAGRRRSSRSGRRRSSRSSSRENVFHLRAAAARPAAGHAARAGDPPPAGARARRAQRRRPRAAARRRGAAAAPPSPRRSSAAIAEQPQLRRARAGRALRDARPDAARRRSAAAALCGGGRTSCALTYPDSVRRAGFERRGPRARARRCSTRSSPRRSGVTFTVDEYDETWRRVATADGRVNLAIPELLAELDGARATSRRPRADAEFPFVLSAGERRSSTANTIFRDPAWRKKDPHGALRMHPRRRRAARPRRRRPGAAHDPPRQRRGRRRGAPTRCSPATSACRTASASPYPDEGGRRSSPASPRTS